MIKSFTKIWDQVGGLFKRMSFHSVQRGKEIHTCNGSDEVTSSSDVSTTVELDLRSFVSVVFMVQCGIGWVLDWSPLYNDHPSEYGTLFVAIITIKIAKKHPL